MLENREAWRKIRDQFIRWYLSRLRGFGGIDALEVSPALGSHSIYYGYGGVAPGLASIASDVSSGLEADLLGFIANIRKRLLEYLGEFGKDQPASLLGGAPGIVLGFIDSGRVFGKCEIGSNERRLIDEIMIKLKGKETLVNGDLGTGLGGYILSLIWIGRRLGPYGRPLLIELARMLIMWVTESPNGLTQKYKVGHSFAPTSGLAHGSAGLAIVFLELGLECNSRQCVAIAKDLIRQELKARWGDRLWPETRIRDVNALPGRGDAGDGFRSTGYTWCYGSSGIIMALRFFESRLGGSFYRRSEKLIIDATVSFIEKTGYLDSQTEFCLCHGIGSLIPIFRHDCTGAASRVLRTTITRALKLIEDVIDGDERLFVASFGTGDKLRLQDSLRNLSRMGYFTGILGLVIVVNSVIEKRESGPLLLPFENVVPTSQLFRRI